MDSPISSSDWWTVPVTTVTNSTSFRFGDPQWLYGDGPWTITSASSRDGEGSAEDPIVIDDDDSNNSSGSPDSNDVQDEDGHSINEPPVHESRQEGFHWTIQERESIFIKYKEAMEELSIHLHHVLGTRRARWLGETMEETGLSYIMQLPLRPPTEETGLSGHTRRGIATSAGAARLTEISSGPLQVTRLPAGVFEITRYTEEGIVVVTSMNRPD